MIYADQRWIGDHGIGRFARHVLPYCDYRPVPLASHPAEAFDAWKLSLALNKLTRNDLFFSPGYNSPLFCAAPFVFAIHDLSHIYCPENSSLAIRLYYASVMKRACKNAAKILTVSDFTRAQIVEWSGVPPEKVFNVGCGVEAAYSPEGGSCTLPFPYLFCVSNRKRHKNEFRTVEAFARSGLASEMHLVFTGNCTLELGEHIARRDLASRVHFMGVVPEAQLPSLYRGAVALVFASLYEGFGLPVLEAMACGTPVLTSNKTALPEIAGDAAVLVDPTSIEEIATAMRRIVSDSALRQQLREKGLMRAARYSWERTAGSVRHLLSTAAEDSGESRIIPIT